MRTTCIKSLAQALHTRSTQEGCSLLTIPRGSWSLPEQPRLQELGKKKSSNSILGPATVWAGCEFSRSDPNREGALENLIGGSRTAQEARGKKQTLNSVAIGMEKEAERNPYGVDGN